MTAKADELLLSVLERARSLGFLGPSPLRVQLEHARRFGVAVEEAGDDVLDLGSGGGLPGLVMAADDRDLRVTLLDASARRCAFLLWAAGELGLADRVEVLQGRAEALAAGRRSSFDAVTARGFGPPSQTVECALGYVRSGGRIVISEPPERREWVVLDLASCRLRPSHAYPGVVVVHVEGVPPPDLPRPIRTQRRNPLPVVAEPDR